MKTDEQDSFLMRDGENMKANYKKGRYIEIPHEEQITFAYLVPIAAFEKMGALIAKISY